jgi:hypothetical protein
LTKHLGSAKHHTVYEAELVGTSLATELIWGKRGLNSMTIGADNRAAIRATTLMKGAPGHYLVDGFHRQIECVHKRHKDVTRVEVDTRPRRNRWKWGNG